MFAHIRIDLLLISNHFQLWSCTCCSVYAFECVFVLHEHMVLLMYVPMCFVGVLTDSGVAAAAAAAEQE